VEVVFYDQALTIPADTKEATPVEAEVKLTHGVITHVEVEFAPGCHGMVSVYIRRGLRQVWPTNPDSYFASDGRAIVWEDYYELFDEPFSVIVGGYSPGTTYDHEIIFRFELTPQEIAERGKVQAGLLTNIGRLLGLVKR
jgi:hypothetical protein